MFESRLHTLTTDLVVLEAVVRALIRVEAVRSPAAMHALLDSLAVEADRLAAGAIPGDPDVAGVSETLNHWIEEIRAEAMDHHTPATALV